MKRILSISLIAATILCTSCALYEKHQTSQFEVLQEKINKAFFAKEYREADILIGINMKKYPGKANAAARMLQWATVKKRLGQTHEAREILMKLLCDYPKSECVPMAEQDLRNLETR